ncbi:hypothetical protein KH5H1_76160 [Corallococcus caeni]|uniref:Uncharacterized protein n=1 Tax=Corallococcus caeni TaxID=3082388 RepID=A0ABQ6R3B9_9BACT|nr:hypothetical protein KH5H1_76160 [Corallococcus sp. KH5-1]GMU09973.1 hypothetical protein ASNO1_62270 [Corallococcus sp. NO1]
MVLLFLGLGMASCGTTEPGPTEEVLPSLDVLHEGAWLMGVDSRERYLLFTAQNVFGTYAKVLPDGGDIRVSDPAEAAIFAQDGDSVLLWSPLSGEKTRTAWLWRLGPKAGIPFTTRSQGDIVHDRALSYVAFTEADAEAGTTSMRVMDAATCTVKACPLRTLLQVPGNTLLLQGGGTTVLASDATRAWLIDVPSGAVTELGTVAGPSVLLGGGSHYSVFDRAGHLQVFDTATRTLQWERSWAEEVDRKDWNVLSALMTDATTVVLNIKEPPPPPPAFPTDRDTVTCDATGCRVFGYWEGACWYGAGRTDLVSCNRTVRCGPYGCEYQLTYFDASMRLLVNTTTSRADSPHAVFNADLSQHASLRLDGSLQELSWDGPAGLRTARVSGQVDTRLFTFLPNAERLVFAQVVPRSDEGFETHLVAWDGVALTDLLKLPGAPASNAQYAPTTGSPTTLYVTVAGPSSLNIVRIRL